MNLIPSFLRKRDRPPEAQEKWVMMADGFKEDTQWYQKALDFSDRAADVHSNTAVSSCVNILAQEISTLRPDHWRVDSKTGARKKVEKSAVTRVLRRPNSYQTSSDFWLYQMRALLLNGNMAGAATRNNRTEVEQIHPLPPGSCFAAVNPDTGDVFYETGNGFGDGLFRPDRKIHSDNFLHIRINCNRHPLVGETPITALNYSGSTGNAIQRAVARFHANFARPSGLLMTPKVLTKKQIDELREQFHAVSTGPNVGNTPVLHSELKWEQVTMTATDAETIASYNLTVADVAMAYRVPLFMLGDLSKATFRNVETLMRLFYTSSLRFYLEHIENGLDRLFELDGESEYIEFDIESGLLRGDLKERVEALTKGIQGGLYKPDEARRREELPPAEGGDELYMQRQMVPLSTIKEMLEAEAKKAAAPPPPPVPPPAPAEDPDEDEGEEANKHLVDLRLRALEEQRLRTLEEEDVAESVSDMMLKLSAMVKPARSVEPRSAVVNVSTPVSVDARLDAAQIGEAIRAGLESMKPHSVTLAPTVIVPSMQEPQIINVTPERSVVNVEAPIVNVAVPKQEVPIVNVEAPTVNVSVPEQQAPIINVVAPEQKAPVVNVSVPEQRAPVVNVRVPEQTAPIVNVSMPAVEQKAPVVNVSVPEQQAPVVNVAAPEVHIAAAEVRIPEQVPPVINVHLPEEPDREQIVEKDEQGEIKRVVSRKIKN